jgi:Zn finger protein HypA/HybF involved in hydrogenase expression
VPVTPFNRTLDQEVAALVRGVSLECLVCGEFVLWSGGAIVCPECGSSVRKEGGEETGLQLTLQAG